MSELTERKKERKKERKRKRKLCSEPDEVTGGGLSVSSAGLSSCAIDSSAISHGPLQGGKKARVNAAAPRRQSVGKKNFVPLASPSCCPSCSPARFSFFLSLLFFFLPPRFGHPRLRHYNIYGFANR